VNESIGDEVDIEEDVGVEEEVEMPYFVRSKEDFEHLEHLKKNHHSNRCELCQPSRS